MKSYFDKKRFFLELQESGLAPSQLIVDILPPSFQMFTTICGCSFLP